MVYTSDALILRTYKLGEADRIVVFLTRDRGKKRGVAKGARRPRSRFTGALEPLTRGEVAYFEREQRDLVAAQLRRAGAVAAAGAFGRGAGPRRLLRRADRRVGAGGARRRAVVPARRLDGRRHCRRGADRPAGALLRVLAAAAAGRVSRRSRARLRGDADARGGDAAAGAPVRLPAVRAVGRRHGRSRPMALRFLAAAGSAGPEKLESLQLSACGVA